MVSLKVKSPPMIQEEKTNEIKRSFELNCCRINSLENPSLNEKKLEEEFIRQTCNNSK